jgi:UDPglucose 6-dehydrogenase
MSDKPLVGFAGLSHLGIIYSMAGAARGFSVVAFDGRPGLAAILTAGEFPVAEPGLEEARREHGARIRYTSEVADLGRCSLIFVALDVTTNDANASDLAPLDALISQVADAASPGTTLVLMSQVPPGYCRKLASRLPANLQLFYLVETLIFGNAVDRAIRPERWMTGCAEPAAVLPPLYRAYLEAFGCPILSMRFESAELCKIAINCFLVSSVSTSNTLAEICEHIGADWSEIIPALRLDKRIGPHAYLSPGLGIAGGNLERDLVTVQRLAAENGTHAAVISAWQCNSEYRRDWVLRQLFALGLLESPGGAPLAVWGLAYKQDTHSTKNSPSLALLRALPRYCWQAYDPAARIDAAEFPNVRATASPLDAALGAAALVLMTPWKQFTSVKPQEIRAALGGRIVLDPYAMLNATACRAAGLDYHRLGA